MFLLTGFGVSARNPVVADSLGLPGDNLDLFGVLELFKKSENPEEFEKALNKEDNKLNNLDLNGDNQIDYIHVIDHTENGAHAIVLQVSVTETEKQDVAVIEIEKEKDGVAHLQIVGDEDLYGKNYIIEPADQAATKAPANNANASNTNVVINVWTWPCVYYVYRPAYVVWISPWGWHHYPGWWSPWRPVYWGVYSPYWHPYRAYHHRVYVHRVMTAHNVYYGHRAVSPVYRSRHPAPVRTVNKAPARGKGKVRPAQPRNQQVAPRSKPRQNKPAQQGKSGRRK
jgi:hypothetical protein